MRRIVLFLAVTGLALSAYSQGKIDVASNKYQGEYRYGKDATVSATGHLIIYPESDTTALFYLKVDNGPPSNSQGMAQGRMVIREGKGYYDNRDGMNCEIIFAFGKKGVDIDHGELGLDCGFDSRVYANGMFNRKSKALITAYPGASGAPVPFSSTDQ